MAGVRRLPYRCEERSAVVDERPEMKVPSTHGGTVRKKETLDTAILVAAVSTTAVTIAVRVGVVPQSGALTAVAFALFLVAAGRWIAKERARG
jgi:hypothetical protein